MVDGNITEEQQETIVNCGALEFSAEKTARVLSFDPEEIDFIIDSLDDPNSDIRRLYDIGKTRAEYKILNKLFQMAQSGDLKALEEYEFRKNNQE